MRLSINIVVNTESNFLKLVVVNHAFHLPFLFKHNYLGVVFNQEREVMVVDLAPGCEVDRALLH